MDLAERVTRRFLASVPFVCWYRVSASKSGRAFRVSIVAAFKPTPATPKRKDPKGFYEYFEFPAGWVDRVQGDARKVVHEAQGIVSKFGLSLNEKRIDPNFEKWTQKPVMSIDYINFLWVGVEVPAMPGQKKTVATITEEFARLSSEFTGEMTIDLVRQS